MDDSLQQTRSEIDEPDLINQALFFNEINTLGIEAGTTLMYTRPISGSTLWGFSTWGLDIWNETYSSGWIIGIAPLSTIGTNRLGASNTIPVLRRVVNPNYVWNERFLDTEFVDTSATTATWSTTGSLIFSSSASKIAQTIPVHLNEENVYSGSISLTGAVFTEDYNWTKISAGTTTFTYTSGTYVMVTDATNDIGWRNNTQLSGDFWEIECKIKGTNATDYLRVQYGISGPGDGWMFQVYNGTNAYLQTRIGGTGNGLLSVPYVYDARSWQVIKVRKVYDTYYFWVNGTYIGLWTSSLMASGYISAGTQSNMTAYISEFKYRTLEDQSLSTSVTCYLSSNGGTNWTQAELDTLTLIDTVGQDLRVKITNKDLGAGLYSNPKIESIKLSYNV
jgi:hypothetical protein